MNIPDYIRSSMLFNGMEDAQIAEIQEACCQMNFEPDDVLYTTGDRSASLFFIVRGVVQVQRDFDGGCRTVALAKSGDTVGELSLVLAGPRKATARANIQTVAWELTAENLQRLSQKNPLLYLNVSRMVAAKFSQADRDWQHRYGEKEVELLIAEPRDINFIEHLVNQTRLSSSGEIRVTNTFSTPLPNSTNCGAHSAEEIYTALEQSLDDCQRVLLLAPVRHPSLEQLAKRASRILWVARDGKLDIQLKKRLLEANSRLTTIEPITRRFPDAEPRAAVLMSDYRCVTRDISWLGRDLAHTHVGLALGAGGARGYAHVGVMRAVEVAGYDIDAVAGSSIGAIVAVCIGMGMTAERTYHCLNTLFSRENLAQSFHRSLTGLSTGRDFIFRLCDELVGNRTFADLQIPVVVMAADLNSGTSVAISEGKVADAIKAAIAMPGLLAPFERGDQRLVDALSLTPVPTAEVRRAGADITVAINLMDEWPCQQVAKPLGAAESFRPPGRPPSRMLETLFEVMDMQQTQLSVRHAAEADIVVAPAFGSGSWRDFDRRDEFFSAGLAAMQSSMALLTGLAGVSSRESSLILGEKRSSRSQREAAVKLPGWPESYGGRFVGPEVSKTSSPPLREKSAKAVSERV